MTSGWWHLRQSAQAMHRGGVIAYPTEAVWGLGCDPYNPDAVARLLEMKRRPEHKGLVLIAGSLDQIHPLLAPLSSSDVDKITASWPGPYTWVIPDVRGIIPTWIKGKHNTVAVRVSAHSGVKMLTDVFGSYIVSTSANPSNYSPARDELRVRTYFGDKLSYVLPGSLGDLSQPTQIRDLATDRLVRA